MEINTKPTQKALEQNILAQSRKDAYTAIFKLKVAADEVKKDFTRKIVAEEKIINNCLKDIVKIKQNITGVDGVEFSDAQKNVISNVLGREALEKIQIGENIEAIAKKRHQIEVCKRRISMHVMSQKIQKKKIALLVKAYNCFK